MNRSKIVTGILAFAAMIRAGLDGIKKEMTPPDPVELNIFHMSEAQRNHYPCSAP